MEKNVFSFPLLKLPCELLLLECRCLKDSAPLEIERKFHTFYFSSSILANSWLVLHFPGSSLPAVSAAHTGGSSRMSHQWSRGLLCLSAHCQDMETHKMTSSRPCVCMFLHKESESDHMRVESWPDLQKWGLCSQPGEMQPGWSLSENNENESFFTADTGSH